MKVLLAVDGSDCSLAAVDEAARMSWPTGSSIKLFSVTDLPTPLAVGTVPMPGAYYVEWEKALEDQAVAHMTQAAARFAEKGGAEIEMISRTVTGDPKTAIVDEARRWGADLIMIGTHGYSLFERFWLGSVSRAVISQAECSVEVVRHPEGEQAGKSSMTILLAVDGSECSDKAVAEVAERPWPAGSHVHVVSAVHLPITPTPETWALPDSYYSNLEKAGLEQATKAIKKALEQLKENASITVTSETIFGHVEDVILSAAKKQSADLIVLGSHSYRGFQKFLLGSVSHAVASHAPCSVEIVRKKSE